MAKSTAGEHSRYLADEADRRAWQYFPAPKQAVELALRFEHPFKLQAMRKIGLSRHYDRTGALN